MEHVVIGQGHNTKYGGVNNYCMMGANSKTDFTRGMIPGTLPCIIFQSHLECKLQCQYLTILAVKKDEISAKSFEILNH